MIVFMAESKYINLTQQFSLQKLANAGAIKLAVLGNNNNRTSLNDTHNFNGLPTL